VYIDVEPVTFNRGYYSCDMTFFFLIEFDVFTSHCTHPSCIKGVAYFSKKVILFGSEGGVKIFSNEVTLDDELDKQLKMTSNMPKCVVQCVDPIALSARIGEVRDCYECCCHIPKCLCDCCGGEIVTQCSAGTPTVYVTLGLFSIVQLIRNVQMLIPVYDFCIPQKQCDDTTDQPCDVFKKIKFPCDDFFPPKATSDDKCAFNCCGNRE
jgi:hypothetical protein